MSSSLDNEYFEWMYSLICDDPRCKYNSYDELLAYLHNTEFTYILDLDSNRAAAGINLRHRFAYETGIPREDIIRYYGDSPCRVFEMMVALAFTCEEDIMGDDEIGNRVGLWFWNMIESLGLDNMDDSNFDVDYVKEVVTRFLLRKYRRNGEGGLFTLKHCRRDLRAIEIWYQMLWYLDENYDFSI